MRDAAHHACFPTVEPPTGEWYEMDVGTRQ